MGSGIYKGIPNKFDQILDPSGTQKVKPTLDQLREGVKYKKGLAKKKSKYNGKGPLPA